MTRAGAASSFYDEIGGHATFVRLVDAFYRGVADDEVLRPMYPEEDLGPAAERLTLFLEQYWGGPTTYSQERGHPRLRMRHASFHVNPDARDRWLAHMRAAVDELELSPLHEATLWDYLQRAAHAMVNTFEPTGIGPAAAGRPALRRRPPPCGTGRRRSRTSPARRRRSRHAPPPPTPPTSSSSAGASPASSPRGEAVAAGKRVVIVDQEPRTNLGGQAWWSFGGLFFVDSPEQRRHGHQGLARPRPPGLVRHRRLRPRRGRLAAALGRGVPAVRRTARSAPGCARRASASSPSSAGPSAAATPRIGPGNSVPRFHITWGTGPGIVAPFQAAVEAGEAEGRVTILAAPPGDGSHASRTAPSPARPATSSPRPAPPAASHRRARSSARSRSPRPRRSSRRAASAATTTSCASSGPRASARRRRRWSPACPPTSTARCSPSPRRPARG